MVTKMRKYLLPQSGKFYKANLHCHSVLSDGKLTVEQLKDAYMKKGYSVIAFADHDKFFSHNDMTDDEFVAINSYEVDIGDRLNLTEYTRKCYHFCCHAQTPDESIKELEDIPKYRDIDEVNSYIKKLNESGFLVCYNHPNWSLQTTEDTKGLKGLWGCEVFNFSSVVDGMDGNQGFMYDVFLREGNRLCCIATDDNHNVYPFEHEQNDSFGGFTMIKADSLSYESIIDAMKKGNCYASSGPEIYDLYIEDGTIHISCSPARHIRFTTDGRPSKSVNSVCDKFITHGEYEIPKDVKYIRVQVTGPDGTLANSNAYWL